MKTLILILQHPVKKKQINVVAVKKQIVEYVGTRMLDKEMSVEEDCPGVALNGVLSTKDKETLAEMLHKAALVFVEAPEEQIESAPQGYLDCILKV